jgi:hypothetical protein
MAKKASRRLVIDASVARASGGEHSKHPTGRRCRDFLNAVLSNNHRLVMTPEISTEWAEHASSFTRKWRVRMYARKRVDHVNPDTDAVLRRQTERLDADPADIKYMLKDLRLIEAAKATDQTVSSRDERVRALFMRASRSVSALRSIVWVNPDRPDENPVDWLQQGAKPEQKRMLGWGG